jgi:hypothetical protein
MPKHVLTMIGIVAAFFGLLWFGVVILGQAPERAMGASLLTLILLGVGAFYTASTLRTDDDARERERRDR